MSWFRYHTDAVDNPKIQSLPAVLFKFWVNLLCVSKISDGFLPEISEVSFRCRCSEKQAQEWITELKRRHLIDELPENETVMHDWNQHQFVSDTSTERVKKHREKRKRNVSGTPPEQSRADNRTETEQSRGTDAPRVQWKADEAFARFVLDYKSTGASLIDEDFTEAYQFGWKPLDWEQKAERVKALGDRLMQFAGEPAFVPKPVKFLKQEWKRPIRPAVSGRPLTAIEQWKAEVKNGTRKV